MDFGIANIWFIFASLFIFVDISLLTMNGVADKGSIEYDCAHDTTYAGGSYVRGQSYTINPQVWIITGGVVGIIHSLFAFCRIGGTSSDLYPFACGCTIMIAFLLFLWAILGFVIHGDFSDDCSSSKIGKIVISWSVIRFIGALCDCICPGLLFLYDDK
eukprot:438758_1